MEIENHEPFYNSEKIKEFLQFLCETINHIFGLEAIQHRNTKNDHKYQKRQKYYKHKLMEIYDLLQINEPDNFLRSNISKRVFEEHLINKYLQIYKHYEIDKIKTLTLIIEHWFKLIHDPIWKYRFDIIFNNHSPPYKTPKLNLKFNQYTKRNSKSYSNLHQQQQL